MPIMTKMKIIVTDFQNQRSVFGQIFYSGWIQFIQD